MDDFENTVMLRKIYPLPLGEGRVRVSRFGLLRCAGLLLRLRPVGLALRGTPSAPPGWLRDILLMAHCTKHYEAVLDR